MANILVVGGGAAGVATSLSIKALAPHAKVVLCERNDRLGGMADSRMGPHGEEYNYGVQGAHESFEYTLKMVSWAQQVDSTIPDPKPANLSAQFVQGDVYWNTAGTGTRSFDPRAVQRFKNVCREAAWAPDVYGLLDIKEACEDNSVSPELTESAVLPTLALFFGTGQQQAGVPASIAAQVFGGQNRSVQIFDLDDTTFITPRNNMKALPPLGPVYRALHKLLVDRGVVVQLNCKSLPDFNKYDKVVLCTQAEDAIRLLPKDHPAIAVLQHAKYYNDVTATHVDSQYMTDLFGASDDFNYYMRDTSTMGFALHRYQGLRKPLYQTIYLNTHDVPAELKTVAVDRWRQVACSAPHLEHCTLQLKRVQGPHVFFAGSYVLVNSHEVAIMSGIRAAQLCLGEKSFPTTLWGTENEAFVALKTFY